MRAQRAATLLAFLLVGLLAACSGTTVSPTPSATGGHPSGAVPTPLLTPAPTPQSIPVPTPTLTPIASLPPEVYFVGPGDTLWTIGQRYDRTVNELLAVNPQIFDRSLIRVGDKITIPSDDVHALLNATVNLPALPVLAADSVSLLPGCVEGRVTFVDGRVFAPGGERGAYNGTWIEDAVRADVDRDGTIDVVVVIQCWPSEGSFDRVVAFRQRADGTFATIGLVLEDDWATDDDHYYEDIDTIQDLEPAPNGEIRVLVGDWTSMIPGVVHMPRLTQWRQYGWDGRAFVQTAGPTRFVAPPGTADLTVDASPMIYGTPVGGTRSGTMTVTVRNRGASAVEDVSVLLGMGSSPASCATSGAGQGPICEVGRIEPGVAATVTFRQSVPELETREACATGDFQEGDDWWGYLQVRIAGMEYSASDESSDPDVRWACR